MSPLTAQDVLSDIEFEVAQSAVSRDDLGQGIQAVRQFQAKTRAEIFDAKAGTLDQRHVISRQFQILEMQTTLLQETAAAIRSLLLDLRRFSQMLPLEVTPEKTEQVEHAMQSDALQVKVDARAVRIPLIGGLLQRLRTALHSLAWFYAQQMGQRQAPINQLYGEQLLHLMDLANAQQQQIAQLDAQVTQLQSQLAARDTTDRVT
jgi:hypothetical protein